MPEVISGREGTNLPDCLEKHETIVISQDATGRVWKSYPIGYWPDHIAISDDLLQAINSPGGYGPHYTASGGDGMVRFTMSSGESALYGQAACDGDHCTHFDRIPK